MRKNIHTAMWMGLISLLIMLPRGLGFGLIPITMEFEPSGRGASRSFRIDNSSAEPVAVQISIVAREMDLDGKETYIPATNEFTIFPPQAVVRPKQSQAVRVTWIGNKAPAKELNYRIIAEQLPVNLKKNTTTGGAVNLVIRYLGTIYIVPRGAKPEVVLESANVEKDPDGKTQLVLVLHNRGTAHSLLNDLKLKVVAADQTLALAGEDQLKGMISENILGQHKRRFKIPCAESLLNQPVKVSFEYNQPR